MEINQITGDVLDAAIKVHQKFGPGLLESVYEKILAIELEKRGHKVACQKTLPIHYEDRTIPDAFRMDLLVDGLVVVELKSTVQMNPVYFKQLRTYLVLSGLQVGLLINFGMNTLKEGFKRIVNNYGMRNNSVLSAREKSHAEDAENAEVETCGMGSGAEPQLQTSSAPSAFSARGNVPHAEDAENAERGKC